MYLPVFLLAFFGAVLDEIAFGTSLICFSAATSTWAVIGADAWAEISLCRTR